MMGFGMGMLGLGALVMVGFWVLVIGGAVWLVMTLVRGSQSQASSTANPPALTAGPVKLEQSPLDILKTRYAKGEITKEQFDEIRRDLGG